MKYYILVEAELRDLPRKVHEQIIHGYTPIGAPFPSPEKSLNGRWLQAMTHPRETVTHVQGKLTTILAPGDDFDAPDKRSNAYAGDPNDGPRGDVGLKFPTAVEMEDAVREANAAHPGSASVQPRFPDATKSGIFGFACEEDRVQWDNDNDAILNMLAEGVEAFAQWDEGKAEAMLNSAKRIFHRRVTHLRQLQQTPYMKHRNPANNADRFEMIDELLRIGQGVMEEIDAGSSARDPYGVQHRPTVKIDLHHAKHLSALLSSDLHLPRSQYPTATQEAIWHFEDIVQARKL